MLLFLPCINIQLMSQHNHDRYGLMARVIRASRLLHASFFSCAINEQHQRKHPSCRLDVGTRQKNRQHVHKMQMRSFEDNKLCRMVAAWRACDLMMSLCMFHAMRILSSSSIWAPLCASFTCSFCGYTNARIHKCVIIPVKNNDNNEWVYEERIQSVKPNSCVYIVRVCYYIE